MTSKVKKKKKQNGANDVIHKILSNGENQFSNHRF